MACIKCEIGERCSAGQVVEAQCHYLKRIPNEDHTKCVCDVGFGEYMLKCEICPPGSVKNYIGDFECDYCSTNEFSDPTAAVPMSYPTLRHLLPVTVLGVRSLMN